MAKRRPIPPYLTLPDEMLDAEPIDGWELLVDGQQNRIVHDKEPFPSWDSLLKFSLRRRFTFDPDALDTHLGIPSGQAEYQFVVRLETAGGRMSRVELKKVLDPRDGTIEVQIAPDSRWLSKDISVACSVVVGSTQGDLGVLSPTLTGSRVWFQTWSAKLEGGRVRLPIEVVSFGKQLHAIAIPNALLHVSVADDPRLEFEQAVCVYLNSDHPRFVAGFESGERSATVMVWDSVVRQVLSAGLSEAFDEEGDELPQDSIGAQITSWVQSIFPGESRGSLAAMRRESPSLFEGRVQSWINAGSFWSEEEA
ncbi:hypothetical protein ACW7G0_11265 [Lysobacter sp. A286]